MLRRNAPIANVQIGGAMNNQKEMMKKLTVALLMTLFIFSVAGVAHGQIYKWIDKNGVIHFGQTPPQGAGTPTKMESALPTTNTPAVGRSQSEGEKIPTDVRKNPPEEKASASQEATVELFSTSWCPYCRKAREFFQARGIPFVEYDIEADAEAARRKQAIDPHPGVPLVVINGQSIFGFMPEAYLKVLGNRPY